MPSSSSFANCTTLCLRSFLPLAFLTIGNVSALDFSSVADIADLVTSIPSSNPTMHPTSEPSYLPSYSPTQNPSSYPTLSALPTIAPSSIPSSSPSDHPTSPPSLSPSQPPTFFPTSTKSFSPSSLNASNYSSGLPTATYTVAPSEEKVLTEEPKVVRTLAPTKMRSTASPTSIFSEVPTEHPSESLPAKVISPLRSDSTHTMDNADPLTSEPTFAPNLSALSTPPLTKSVSFDFFLTLPSSEIMADTQSFETATFNTASQCSFNVTSVVVTEQKLTVKQTDLVVYFSIFGTVDEESSGSISTLNAELTSCFEYRLAENIDRATGIFGLLDNDRGAPHQDTESKFPFMTVGIIAGSTLFAIAAFLSMFMLSRKRRHSRQKIASAKLEILQNMEDADGSMLGKDFEHAKEASLSLDNMSSFSLSIEEGNMRTPTEKQALGDFELQIDTASAGDGEMANVGMKDLSPLDRSYSTGIRTHNESSNILCSPMKAESPNVLCMARNHNQSPSSNQKKSTNYDEVSHKLMRTNG